MLGSLTDKFKSVFSSLSDKTLSEENISEAVREVRLALLDADVNFSVASQFVKRVKEKALGLSVTKSVSPKDEFTKVIHDELIELMGGDTSKLNLKKSPSVILMCGLQASGKTTQTAKLANFLQKKPIGKRVMMAACDLQRPAAVLQLKKLGDQIDVPVFSIEGETNPIKVAKEALKEAKKGEFDVLLVDTAGRLHVDDDLMKELEKVRDCVDPSETLFVASANMGQDAVKTAEDFDQRIGITGTILTMLDGSARAGAAISIREVTGKPLKFEGIGEKLDDIQPFNPRSMADRILGMGDVINLVRKAQEHTSDEDTEKLKNKLKKASFTYSDFLDQMEKIQKMGSLKGMLKMLPGADQFADLDASEEDFKKLKAMILSMTRQERNDRVDICHGRRNRIARGSGTSVDDVNRMIKGFKQLKGFFKKMPAMKGQLMKGLGKKMLFGKLPF